LFQAAQPVIYLDSENISMRAIGRGIWIGLCGAFGFTLLPQLSQTSSPQDSIFSMIFMVSKPRTSPDEGQKARQPLAKLGLLVLSCFLRNLPAPLLLPLFYPGGIASLRGAEDIYYSNASFYDINVLF
jgi:hypothetical protein